jgi:hypothetical protein
VIGSAGGRDEEDETSLCSITAEKCLRKSLVG